MYRHMYNEYSSWKNSNRRLQSTTVDIPFQKYFYAKMHTGGSSGCFIFPNNNCEYIYMKKYYTFLGAGELGLYCETLANFTFNIRKT